VGDGGDFGMGFTRNESDAAREASRCEAGEADACGDGADKKLSCFLEEGCRENQPLNLLARKLGLGCRCGVCVVGVGPCGRLRAARSDWDGFGAGEGGFGWKASLGFQSCILLPFEVV